MSDNLWFDLSAAGSSAVFGIAAAAFAVAIAALAVSHTFASSLVRRTVWQVAIVATLGFCALELSGIGQASLAAFQAAVQAGAEPPTETVAHSHRDSAKHDDELAATIAPLADATLPFGDDRLARLNESDDGSFAEFSASWAAAIRPAETLPHVGQAVAVPPIASGADPSRADENDVAARAVAAFGMVWLAGTMLLFVRALLACRGMSALVRQLPEYADADAATASGVRQLAALFRYRRPVRLVGLPSGTSPLAFGVVRPTIGLPADFSRRFTADERRAMLAHELAHLAAGDPLWRTLADVLVAALWWHPAAWFVRRRLIEASELVADEASRAVPGGAEHLASALVVLGKRLARRRAVAAYGADGEFRSSLGRRVERLLSECERPWRPVSNGKLAVARAACGAAAVAVLLSVCYAQRSHLSSTPGESEMKTFAATWRQSLCGVALAMFAGGSAAADTPAAELAAGATTVAVVQQDDEEEREGPRREGEGEREGDRPREGERRIDAPPRRDRPEGEREGDERAEARRREAREIEARVERIRNRLRELGDRNPDESRELSQQAERLANRLRELRGEGERREGDRPGRDRPDRDRPDRERPDRERPDRERPDRERSDRERPDRERPEGDRPRGDRPDREGGEPRRPRPEQVERARHLRAAIEHLRAAGMPDLAERLSREHEELMRTLRDRPEGDRPGPGFRDPPPRERPDRPGRPDRPDRPDGPPRVGDRPRPDRPDRPDGPPREGERPRPDRPDRPDRLDRPDGDRRPDAERREEAQRESAELRRALAAQHEAGDALRLKLEAVARALAERTERAQAEEAARQAALKQLEAARAAEQAKLAELAERRAAELALVQAELQAQMAKLKAEVEKLRDELAAKEAELTKTRELIEQRAK
ncbi:MAG: hypothetical protein DCC68_04135 [Planctomycetota bacterium]|nr:MAG: hypothetical protein DCC68_04135 [Planctomycetota bacterium]